MCEPLTCTLWGNGGWLGWRQEPARERGQGAGAAGAVGLSSSRLAGRACRPNTASTCDRRRRSCLLLLLSGFAIRFSDFLSRANRKVRVVTSWQTVWQVKDGHEFFETFPSAGGVHVPILAHFNLGCLGTFFTRRM